MPNILIHKYGVVESTNDIALAMAKQGQPAGTVVTALQQTAGRGRRGRKWYTGSGECAMLSAILDTAVSVSRAYELSFVTSLAAARYIQRAFALQASLKWPNDVYIDNRKIAGILIETTSCGDCMAAVAGIGLNINQSSFPEEIRDVATSIAMETDCIHDIDGCCMDIADELFAVHQEYLDSGFGNILADWRQYMWGLGKHAQVRAGNDTLCGTIDGVGNSGELLLRTDSGTITQVYAADTIRVMISGGHG